MNFVGKCLHITLIISKHIGFRPIKPIKIIKTKGTKTGPGNARNIGVREAKGEFIGYLDADDEWSDNYLRKMLDLAKKDGVAFAPTRVYDQNNFLIKQVEVIKAHPQWLQLKTKRVSLILMVIQ